ncbi:MAG TPA: exosortase E/protease, VPEID-CTERM system [Candidatus Binataceae bacterium]|nr:exosortase E/protease, VPEID-CTERM system [Candidatus Binataceae bacterium]
MNPTESNDPLTTRAPARYEAWGALGLILIGEFVALTLPYESGADFTQRDLMTRLLGSFQQSLRPAFITGVLAAAFFSRRTLREEFQRAIRAGGSRRISWRWLGMHLSLLAAMVLGTIHRRAGQLTSITGWEGWLTLWALLAMAAMAAWCFTLAPPRFWQRWIERSGVAFALGGAVGFSAFALGMETQNLWWPLQRSTFVIVVFLLRLVGQNIVVVPAQLIIGTSTFAVTIGSACSGIEGIGLVTIFVAAYLWYCRRELRFPHALALLPLGICAIWLLNCLRIAALILVGNWNPTVAIKGFHSVAGWLFFNLVIGGLVWASSRSRFFSLTAETPAEPNPAAPYILPLLVIIAAAMLTRAFSPGLEGLFAAGAGAGLLGLWHYRTMLLQWRWRPTWLSFVAGATVAAIWLVSARTVALPDLILAPPNLFAAPFSAWVTAGLIGGALVAPVAEELAFRGYLARRLVSADFASVPFAHFSWIGLLGSSIVSGIAHVHWLPATISALTLAIVMYRSGRLTDAIAAHLTASAILLAYTLTLVA